MTSPANKTRYAILHEYWGTVNGEPVGDVYAVDINHISPGCWSYTKNPQEATTFETFGEAEQNIRRSWRNPRIVEVEV